MALFNTFHFLNFLLFGTQLAVIGRVAHRKGVQGPQPRAYYPVTARKRTDPGARRRRREARDERGWRRSPLGTIDPYMQTVMQAVVPSSSYPARDPRRQSKFLGHVIDGALGWVTDVVHHVPLVGPLVGHPLRLVCRVVRAGENACNAVTGVAGIHLFIIVLLSLPSPGLCFFNGLVSSLSQWTTFNYSIYEDHVDYWIESLITFPTAKDPPLPSIAGGYAPIPLSNCCNTSDVTFCSEYTCLHSTGCVVCEQAGNETLCWEPAGPMVSHRPNYTGVDPWLSAHIDFVAGSIYFCDLAAMHEVCGLLALASSYFVEHMPITITLNTTAPCYLLAETGANPSLTGFFGWLASEVSMVTGLVDTLWKVPAAVGYAFGERHYVTIAAITGLALNGNIPKALALLVLYVEAAVAAPIKSEELTCNPMSQPPPCRVAFNGTQRISNVWCFSKKAAFQPLQVDRFAHDILNTLIAAGVSTKNFTSRASRPRHYAGGLGCVYLSATGNYSCCALKVTPPYCSGCSSDCTWWDRRLRYETCGTTPWLSTACDLRNGSCTPRVVASLALPFHVPRQSWKTATASLISTAPFVFFYDPWVENQPPHLWARLPGIPTLYRGSWYNVPKGFYSDFRDLSTGLITKDMNYPNYQVSYSATGAFQIAGVTTHIVIMAILAALGARWCLALYAMLHYFPSVYSLSPGLVAATAAADWADWYVRLFVFLLVFKYPKLGWLLCRRWQFSVILLVSLLTGTTAYDLESVAVAGSVSLVTLLYFGFFSFVSPFLTLTLSYLRERLQLEVTTWDPRVFLVCILCFPRAVVACSMTVWLVYGLLGVLPLLIDCVFGVRDHRQLKKTLHSISLLPRLVAKLAEKLCVWAAAERGVFWFRHLHGKLDLQWPSEPYFPLTTERVIAEDAGRKLACGDSLRGLPVYARCGNTVAAGVCALPKGWSRTTPFSLKRRWHRSDFRSLAVCLTGHDDLDVNGSICVMGTPLKTWMGFGFDGKLYTALHGSHHKMLAGTNGAVPPILTDTASDVAVYPLPQGFACLEAGSCDCSTFYLPTKVGRLVTCTKHGDHYTPLGPLTLKEAKGSSGSPLLCKHKYVHGMFRSVSSVRGAVSKLHFSPIASLSTLQARRKEAKKGLTDIPVVGKQKSIEILVAPTGSGKSTKLPMEYYNQGYKVLVLNPSVATTKSMGPYMFETYNVRPNILCGDEKSFSGSRLTYSTYGMFLACGNMNHDVIICDECHATDPTSVLGIGRALMRFEESDYCKLLILATATPPGVAMSPHENITEHRLGSDGDLEYEGKTIQTSLLKKGRHLIFCTSKKKCEELANTLADMGITAVAYYRGLSVTTIPEEGDVVVVATDALMTGYTGNFDSVYDPCVQVEQQLEVDMDPTFSISLATRAATTVTRMQRRGRTGRGKPGDYYYITPAADTSGLVSAATVYECYDSGIAYYGLTPAETYTALDYFKQQPGLSQITCPLDEVCGLFTTIGHVPPSAVATMKQRVDSYVYLHAWHWQAALEAKAKAPNDDPAWRGLKGSNRFPIICKLQDFPTDNIIVDRLAFPMQQCYQEYYCIGATATLTGLGLGVAAVFVAIDLFGNISIRDVWALTDDSTAAKVYTPTLSDPVAEVEECVSWDGMARAANEVSVYLGDKLSALGKSLGGKDPLIKKVEAVVPHMLAAIQYFAGLACLSEAPGLGVVLGFVGSALSPLPLKVNLFLSALGGAVSTRLTTQWGAACFAAAGALGAMAGASSAFNMIMQGFGTYGAAASTCLVVLKLCDGQWPSMAEWSQLALNILSPGALVAGAGAALMVVFCTRTESQVWMNRLLAMLNKGTSCDSYFVEATTLRATIIRLLERCTLWSIFTQLSNWIHRQDEDLCASPRSCFMSFISTVGGICRMLVEAARGVVRCLANPPGIPYFQCQRGYKGPWTGTGLIRSTCGCGAETTWYVQDSEVRPTSVPRRCCSWWTGRVPINNTFWGTPRPRPASWKTMVVNSGFSNCIKYELRGNEVWMVGVSYPGQVVTPMVPDLMAAVAVDDVQVKPYAGVGWQKTGPWQVTMQTGEHRETKELPIKLTVGACWGEEPPKDDSLTKEDLEDYNIKYQLELMDMLDQRAAAGASTAFETASTDSHDEPGTSSSSSPAGSSAEPTPAPPSTPKKSKGKVRRLILAPPSKPILFGTSNPAFSSDCSSTGVPVVKCVTPSGAKPLPDVKRKGDNSPSTSAYALGSDEWETMSGESELIECSTSYVWSVPNLVYKGLKRCVAAVSTYTAGILRYKPLVYTTTYASVNERVKKVTIKRSRLETKELREVIREAKVKLKHLDLPEMSLDEALAITPNKSAKSQATGLTAPLAKAGQTSDIQRIYAGLKEGVASPWNEVCIMPKQEIFIKTPEKPSKKPARIIAYPHLEMRVVEKMVLGHIGPATVKTVLGDAYGFVPPYERVEKLVRMWRSKDSPGGFVCDTVCFDSTITPEDVAVECELYQQATNDPDTQARIATLHRDLYQGGPMVMQGALVGRRNCRASGVFTTSSSNTMTCWLKVNAAARIAKIKDPSWLICGDDTVCIFESESEDLDKKKLQCFAAAMKTMGAPQGEVPKPYYHLEYLESCQANVSACQTKFGTFHYLTRDPRIPMARISSEGRGFNPLGTMVGYMIANYPAVWVSRVIAVHFLSVLLTQDCPDKVEFEWYGNNYSVPLDQLPYIIQALHGEQVWSIKQYTPREITRCGQALKEATVRPLRYYKRMARQVWAACRRRRGTMYLLGKTLLSWVHSETFHLDKQKVRKAKAFSPFDPYQDPTFDPFSQKNYNWLYVILSAAGFIAVGILALIGCGQFPPT
nr:polyprotein [Rodent hepacivirus]